MAIPMVYLLNQFDSIFNPLLIGGGAVDPPIMWRKNYFSQNYFPMSLEYPDMDPYYPSPLSKNAGYLPLIMGI
jgi:hypothetical protein